MNNTVGTRHSDYGLLLTPSPARERSTADKRCVVTAASHCDQISRLRIAIAIACG